MRGVAAAVAGLLLLAGCGGGVSSREQPTGTVHGLLMQTGGPSDASAESGAGTVVLSRGSQEVQRQDVVAGEQYSFTVPAGDYVLTIKGVEGACAPESVTVSAQADSRQDLICSRK